MLDTTDMFYVIGLSIGLVLIAYVFIDVKEMF